jgi:hypothetical protein
MPSRSSLPTPCHGQHDAGLRVLLVAREWFAVRQDQMHAHGTDAVHGTDGACEFALHRAGLVDLLLELGGCKAIRMIEDLVADGATRGEALAGQCQSRLGHLFGRHQDLAAVAADAIRDVPARKLVHHLRGVAQVQIAVEQCHRFGAATQHHQRQHAKHTESNCAHRGEPGRAQGSQTFHEGLHHRHLRAPSRSAFRRVESDSSRLPCR